MYSKNKVIKATKDLVKNNLSFEERNNAIRILADYRSLYEYPIQSMLTSFINTATRVDKKAIVVRRLKRIPSIVGKIRRFPKMKITRMGDIGGIRIILNDIKDVFKVKEMLLKRRTKNKLVSEKDYITNPKISGYRSIHLTYAYNGLNNDYKGLRIELQIRSKIQHSWATAVEVAGTFNRQNLKAGLGNEKWLFFFENVSKAFASLEKKETIEAHLRKEIQKQVNDLNIINVLEVCSVAIKNNEKKKGWYLLQLNTEKKEIYARYEKYLEEITEEYRRIEQEISEDNTKDVVMVSASSLKELKQAYPNYFADTDFFIANLKRVLT